MRSTVAAQKLQASDQPVSRQQWPFSRQRYGSLIKTASWRHTRKCHCTVVSPRQERLTGVRLATTCVHVLASDDMVSRYAPTNNKANSGAAEATNLHRQRRAQQSGFMVAAKVKSNVKLSTAGHSILELPLLSQEPAQAFETCPVDQRSRPQVPDRCVS